MRIVKKPKITFKYVGDGSKADGESTDKILETVYNRIFAIAFKNLQTKNSR